MQVQERVIQANLDLRNEKDYLKNRGKLWKTRILFDSAVQVMTFQPQTSTPDLSIQDFSTMNFSTMGLKSLGLKILGLKCPYNLTERWHFNPGLFNPRLFNREIFRPMIHKFMVEKFGVEKFMVEKPGVERSSVEAWGWKVRGWDVLQQHQKLLPRMANLHQFYFFSFWQFIVQSICRFILCEEIF